MLELETEMDGLLLGFYVTLRRHMYTQMRFFIPLFLVTFLYLKQFIVALLSMMINKYVITGQQHFRRGFIRKPNKSGSFGKV